MTENIFAPLAKKVDKQNRAEEIGKDPMAAYRLGGPEAFARAGRVLPEVKTSAKIALLRMALRD